MAAFLDIKSPGVQRILRRTALSLRTGLPHYANGKVYLAKSVRVFADYAPAFAELRVSRQNKTSSARAILYVTDKYLIIHWGHSGLLLKKELQQLISDYESDLW